MNEPSQYQYQYTNTQPTGSDANVVAYATGDLDCDGAESTWTLHGDGDLQRPVGDGCRDEPDRAAEGLVLVSASLRSS